MGAVLGAAGEPAVAPYGSWRSPITTQMLVAGAVRFGDLSLDGDTLYWVEGRPEEEGRQVVCRRTADGPIDDVLPPPFSARTLVHEYGGGAMLAAGGTVYFTNYADQRIWRVRPGEPPQPITAESESQFADFVLDAARDRLIAVCEDHAVGQAVPDLARNQAQPSQAQPDLPTEPTNRVVAVDLASGNITPLVVGADFYSTPRISPDGRRLAWVQWDHPNMPWDDTELLVADFRDDGSLGTPRKVAGGADESIYQPAWAPDGTLYFVSDRSNWWNLYADAGDEGGSPRAILPMDAEFGVPHWVFGTATYGFTPGGEIIARRTQRGDWSLLRIDPQAGKHDTIDLPFTNIGSLRVGDGRAYAVVGSPAEVDALVEIDLATGDTTVIRRGSPTQPDPAYTSIPEPIEFPTDGGLTAHAFYYPPTNHNYRAPEGELPPLIVTIHGGPTSATSAQYRLSTQFWTSRGFAVCDVNYGGSTGYGREYRNRLRDAWGIVDVADAANAALYLAEQGKADRARLIIRGGSAGGYTTLAAIAFRDVFACGASHYGISDLALLARDTHKFESRYLDRLVGRYPEDEHIYRARSPIHHLNGFDRPVILLQGLEDKVVPPDQAESILAALKASGVPVAYVPFPGEQHGFRKAENIIRAHEAELYFYSRVFDFRLPEPIEPVEIFNLPAQEIAN